MKHEKTIKFLEQQNIDDKDLRIVASCIGHKQELKKQLFRAISLRTEEYHWKVTEKVNRFSDLKQVIKNHVRCYLEIKRIWKAKQLYSESYAPKTVFSIHQYPYVGNGYNFLGPFRNSNVS